VVANLNSNVTWATNYFASIRGVCPWSYKAHMKDNILFIEGGSDKCFGTYANIYKASTKEAFVFILEGKTSKELDELCLIYEQLYTHVEWLWSHPEQEGDSTPKPVIIIQDKATLQQLREKVDYEEDIT
jgi:hypothetical protein